MSCLPKYLHNREMPDMELVSSIKMLVSEGKSNSEIMKELSLSHYKLSRYLRKIRSGNLRMKEKKNNISVRLNIVTYELGRVVRSVTYAQRFPDRSNAYLADAKLEIGDLLTMIHMLCQELGFSFDELRELGYLHTKERYDDFESNKWVEA